MTNNQKGLFDIELDNCLRYKLHNPYNQETLLTLSLITFLCMGQEKRREVEERRGRVDLIPSTQHTHSKSFSGSQYKIQTNILSKRDNEGEKINREAVVKTSNNNYFIDIIIIITLFFTTFIFTIIPSFSFNISFLRISILTEE